ncbi:hypothetical protein CURTO8I2_90012 [Curtobacterium sp. 8I-2]|nr:hypothetical protein CURTO8I2_90012 [Curtobacterium sp. 8I-2]
MLTALLRTAVPTTVVRMGNRCGLEARADSDGKPRSAGGHRACRGTSEKVPWRSGGSSVTAR